MASTIDGRLSQSCRQWKDKAALLFGDDRWSHGDLLSRARRVAALLAAHVAPSRHVGLLGQNHPDYIAGLFGALLAGRTVVPLNPLQAPPELARVIEHSEQRLLLCTRKTLPLAQAAVKLLSDPPQMVVLEDVPESMDADYLPKTNHTADDLAMILYTSGTTGDAKGVMLTHGNFLENARQYSEGFHFAESDHFYVILPLFHIFAVTTEILSGLLSGATLVLYESFNPKALLRQFTELPSGVFIAVPPMYAVLARSAPEGYAGQHKLRVCVSGGGPMPGEVQRQFEAAFGMDVCEGYGLTEAAPVLCSNVPGHNRKGCVGRAYTGTELRVCDESGCDVPAGAEGELWARGPNIMKGYYKNPVATAEALTPDGWLRTGDLVRIDENGYVAIVGRKKDVIVSAGENIYPREIEEVLAVHPSVLEAAVVGVPDERRGEVPKAFVVTVPEASVEAGELVAWCKERLGAYKIPHHWEVVSALPKTATGKVQKNILRQS